MLELKNIPTGLILYAVQQWLPCQKYTKGGAMPKNTNTFLRAVSVWLILKSETSSGKIKNYRTQLPELAAKCKMSTRTLEKYINWLRVEKFAAVEDHDLVLENYKALRRFGINPYQREQTIYYDTTNEVQLSEIFISIAIMHYKERWITMYGKKLKHNPDKYAELYNLLVEFKADPTRLQDPGYFREWHLKIMLKTFQEEKPGHSFPLAFLHRSIQANPDINARADTYAFKFGYSHAMSFCHLKRRLARKGLITVCKRRPVESRQRARKDTDTYHLRWNKYKKETVWFLPDQIEINAGIFLQKRA